MLFLKKDEIKNSINLPPFVIITDTHYYGIFVKENNKLKSYGIPTLLPTDYLPTEFRRNYKFVEDVIKFISSKKQNQMYMKVYKKGSHLYFDGIVLRKYPIRFLHSKEIGIIPDINRMKNYSLENFRENSKLLLSLIPKETLKLINNSGVVLIESNEKIPFELLSSEYNVMIKNIVSFNKKHFPRNYIKRITLISNNWDNRFNFTKEETLEIFNKIKDKFTVEFISTPLTQEEILKTLNENDVVLISSHSDKYGIDLGNTKLTTSLLKSITKPPKLIFLNLCYYEGIDEIVKTLLDIGVNAIIYPYLRIPDSFQTKYFVITFFETLSRTYDIDFSFYIAIKSSKTKNHYNYMLYRFCV